jgi:hypothetical protein
MGDDEVRESEESAMYKATARSRSPHQLGDEEGESHHQDGASHRHEFESR